MKVNLKPGFLDQLATDIGVTSDKELAKFLGLTVDQLETLRYGGRLTNFDAAILAARRAAHMKALMVLDNAG